MKQTKQPTRRVRSKMKPPSAMRAQKKCVSREDREWLAHVRALRGKYANVIPSTEVYLRLKKEEEDLED